MERASQKIAEIIDRTAFQPHSLVDMTARREAALSRARKILASSELVDSSYIDDLKTEISNLEQLVAEKDIEKDALEKDIWELREQVEEVTKSADKLQDVIQELNSIIEHKNETIKELEEGYEKLYNEVHSAKAG